MKFVDVRFFFPPREYFGCGTKRVDKEGSTSPATGHQGKPDEVQVGKLLKFEMHVVFISLDLFFLNCYFDVSFDCEFKLRVTGS